MVWCGFTVVSKSLKMNSSYHDIFLLQLSEVVIACSRVMRLIQFPRANSLPDGEIWFKTMQHVGYMTVKCFRILSL